MKHPVGAGLCCLVLAAGWAVLTSRGRGEEPKAEKWPRIDRTEYAGSARCAECHKTHYDGWKDSAHNKMIRPPVADGPNRTVFADFSRPSPDRDFELKDVKYVIGHRWK
jgi:hypothetical protein